MSNAIPDTDRRQFTPDQIDMMQTIFLSLCAELAVPLDHHATREAMANTILREFEQGNRDVAAVTEAARLAVRLAA